MKHMEKNLTKQEWSQNQQQHNEAEALQTFWLILFAVFLPAQASHLPPVVSSTSVSPRSAGRCGVTRRAEEDQRHVGGDSEEDGHPVQTGQQLQHRRKTPGWAQLSN